MPQTLAATSTPTSTRQHSSSCPPVQDSAPIFSQLQRHVLVCFALPRAFHLWQHLTLQSLHQSVHLAPPPGIVHGTPACLLPAPRGWHVRVLLGVALDEQQVVAGTPSDSEQSAIPIPIPMARDAQQQRRRSNRSCSRCLRSPPAGSFSSACSNGVTCDARAMVVVVP